MAQKEFLQGEITEQFLANAAGQPLQDQGEALAFPTPTIVSILCCPSMLVVCTQ